MNDSTAKVTSLLEHVREQVEKQHYLNAASAATDLVGALLGLLSAALKGHLTGNPIPARSADSFDRVSPDEVLPRFLRVGSENFGLAETCVTQAQYRLFCALAGWEFPKQPLEGATRPVVNVTLLDAHVYCMWLGQQSGTTVRLPTREEWLKATSPDEREYAWGGEAPDHARCDFWQERKIGPDPVDAHPTGAGMYGHLGLSGGVWEWTIPTSYRKSERVICGSSWRSNTEFVRATWHYGWPSGGDGRDDLGFRPLREYPRGS